MEVETDMENAITSKVITQTDIEAVLVFIEALLADEPTDQQVGERVLITRREITNELKRIKKRELIGSAL